MQTKSYIWGCPGKVSSQEQEIKRDQRQGSHTEGRVQNPPNFFQSGAVLEKISGAVFAKKVGAENYQIFDFFAIF